MVCLSIKIAALFLGIFNSGINEMRIGGLVGSGQDQRGISRRILCRDRETMISIESTTTHLRLVGIDRCVFAASANLILKRDGIRTFEISRVGDNDSPGRFELVKRAGHGDGRVRRRLRRC